MNLSEMSGSDLRTLQDKVGLELIKREQQHVAAARDEILAIAKNAGIALQDIIQAKPSAEKKTVATKFRHPEQAELQWTGRGRQPLWVRDWLVSGKDIDLLRV
ncbi:MULTISPECIES: H-NS family nucleoid-associated regulatory protein [unclassified Janthinobacterium]|uniref:H-NS histone family protein n=1 Tax=unclassified Janthinobacterium TaxID=2610881 RepID=UPI001618280E|nr:MULTISPECIES: H-NS histone family protein [unclassified Janthinobacterium]MBB5367884.1 DNA-binding protein H-NS [Janthinobacterium sp. K2C7]MBB5379638.1 DNA-binding protein H-NS [Janthinobacterium sp. K2Li3]MBB5386266.1 DNA-binding protein H-NS [Janthinobacterium sp. K2E3]